MSGTLNVWKAVAGAAGGLQVLSGSLTAAGLPGFPSRHDHLHREWPQRMAAVWRKNAPLGVRVRLGRLDGDCGDVIAYEITSGYNRGPQIGVSERTLAASLERRAFKPRLIKRPLGVYLAR